MIYTDEQRFIATRQASKLNLDLDFQDVQLNTFWCRVYFHSKEKFNENQHIHSHFELHLCLSGTCEIETDGKTLVLHEGQFICLPKNLRHRIVSETQNFIKFIWAFSVNRDNPSLSDENLNPVVVYDSPPVISAMIDSFLFCGDIVVKKISLCAIFQLIKNIIVPIERIQEKTADETRFNVIRQFISDNLGNDLTIGMVCCQFFVSERQLNRICQECCGVSIGKLIKTMRLEKIKFLLKNTDMKLKEIAFKVGFSDEFSMSKSFKAMEGISPSEFRESAKK